MSTIESSGTMLRDQRTNRQQARLLDSTSAYERRHRREADFVNMVQHARIQPAPSCIHQAASALTVALVMTAAVSLSTQTCAALFKTEGATAMSSTVTQTPRRLR